mgnify:CR=1 FL=1|jgi:hypothetical protein
MAIEVFNRYENKYLMDEQAWRRVYRDLMEYMVADEHNSQTPFYTICNLYFDTPTDELILTIPEDLAYEEAFAEVFRKFQVKHELLKVRTTELGSLYELVYAVEISDAVKQKEFMDEIRCRNGNLDITLTMKPTPAEA